MIVSRATAWLGIMNLHAPQRRLVENPWFWVMLFGCTASVGVVVIGPKHAARQARIERMSDTRTRIATAREAGVATGEVQHQAETDADGATPIEPYVDADFRRSPRLQWLLGAAVAVMLVGTAGLIASRRRPIDVAETDTSAKASS